MVYYLTLPRWHKITESCVSSQYHVTESYLNLSIFQTLELKNLLGFSLDYSYCFPSLNHNKKTCKIYISLPAVSWFFLFLFILLSFENKTKSISCKSGESIGNGINYLMYIFTNCKHFQSIIETWLTPNI